ncbi:MAG: glycosyltransferase family 4 protein [Armatimonadota bacterium]|nr:glycosyltransferase family 4 protein [Armatimonadota bacterium]
MRVVHVLPKFSTSVWGGAETLVAALAKTWTAGRVEVWTCRLPGDRARERIGCAEVRRFAAFFPGGRTGVGDGRAGLPPVLFARLARVPRPQTIVHVHCHNRLAAGVIAACRLLGLRTVLTVHSRVMRLGPRWRYWFPNEYPLRGADVVAAVSEAVRGQVRSVAGRAEVELVPNGVDLRWINGGDRLRGRRHLGVDREAQVILFCGRISRIKNLDALLQATRQLAEDVPDIRLVIVGPAADPEYAAELRHRVAQSRLRGRVSFVGPVPSGSVALADFYAAADVVAVPSTWEAHPMSVLEAWGAGRTVVVADVGGMGELVRQQGVGRLWDPRTGGSGLAREIQQALRQTRDGSALEQRARAAAGRFDIRRTAASYQRLYEDLLSRRTDCMHPREERSGR